MHSSTSGRSVGLSGGWSSLRMPGLSSPDTSSSRCTSEMSLRDEIDDTLRLERTESDRFRTPVAADANPFRNESVLLSNKS